jgi:hypothetical protein
VSCEQLVLALLKASTRPWVDEVAFLIDPEAPDNRTLHVRLDPMNSDLVRLQDWRPGVAAERLSDAAEESEDQVLAMGLD